MLREPLWAVVLAAGEGTRMQSSRPKPLHRLCGRPMVLHVLHAVAELPVERVVVVVGHRGEWLTKLLADHAPPGLPVEIVEQPTPKGTGDALAVGLTSLPAGAGEGEGDVLVVPGDTPLVRAGTLAQLVAHHRASGAAATVLTAVVGDPIGCDRVVRGRDDGVVAIVEDAEIGVDEQAITEIATPVHCVRHAGLAPALRRLRPVGPRREASLTGLYAVLRDAGYRVESLAVADPAEAVGVNDRLQLARAETELRRRINERWMGRGVTMWDPARTYIDVTVDLEADVVLSPGVVLQGECRIGRGVEIGPECHLVDTVVGAGAVLRRVSAERATIGEQARVGPFVALGPGAVLPTGTSIGPFTHLEGDFAHMEGDAPAPDRS